SAGVSGSDASRRLRVRTTARRHTAGATSATRKAAQRKPSAKNRTDWTKLDYPILGRQCPTVPPWHGGNSTPRQEHATACGRIIGVIARAGGRVRTDSGLAVG